MLLTSPITAVLNIFSGQSNGLTLGALGDGTVLILAFEALRPTPPPSAVKKDKDVVVAPSYLPIMIPMVVYVLCQGLVYVLPCIHIRLTYTQFC